MRATTSLVRFRIEVSGVVQGVGFRPFVYSLATRLDLTGFVRNNNGMVEIEIQGVEQAAKDFLQSLSAEAPPLAIIEAVHTWTMALNNPADTRFQITSSVSEGITAKFVPADTSTCDQCMDEVRDPTNRRFRYAFTNCTNCGPRFTIIKSLPYDRPATTMKDFTMCQLCQSEYNNPADRRFHAQPNACLDCGPVLTWSDYSGKQAHEDAIFEALRQLHESEIIAVKSLGGYHLIADAASPLAVLRLRRRKKRQRKPFALMMADIDMVRLHCQVSEAEEKQLRDPSRPIVLLEKLDSSSLPNDIAPGIRKLGVMLPYTPLHHLLLSDYRGPLIATSGNLTQEPIVIDNEDAHSRLGPVVCGFLDHNREICSRYDDSIVHLVNDQPALLRRSRGIAPKPLKLPLQAERPVLACGAHLKNTFCLINNDQAYISQHIGDLDSVESTEHFERALGTYIDLFDLSYDLIAHDRHPDYLSTQIAESLGKAANKQVISVQHHHAHIVSCMVENGITHSVIGVAFDGLGLGDDGTLWGGEFLVTSLDKFHRRAHIEAFPMPGGNTAVKRPWRMALSYLLSTGTLDSNCFPRFRELIQDREGEKAIAIVSKQISERFNAPLTSSCGRLFDAISALLGICTHADYEGQAAMELESLATQSLSINDILALEPYTFELGCNSPIVIRPATVLTEMAQDIKSEMPLNIIAARFHRTIAEMVCAVCETIGKESNLVDVCLSGGVFQNKLLLTLLLSLLPSRGFKVHFQKLLPANDGGLSLGQAVIALAQTGALSLQTIDGGS